MGLPRRPCINGVRIAFRQEPCLVQNCPYTLLMSIEANFFYPTSLGTDRGDFKIQDLNCPNRQNACISKPTSSLYIFTPLQQNLSSFVTTCTHLMFSVPVPPAQLCSAYIVWVVKILDRRTRQVGGRSTGTQRNGGFVPLEPVDWCDLVSS